MIKKITYLLAWIVFFTFKSYAFLNIEIVNFNEKPVPIVVANFSGAKEFNKYIVLINKIIEEDLKKSGMFAIYRDENKIQYDFNGGELDPYVFNYNGFSAVLFGNIFLNDLGQTSVEFILWDLYNMVILDSFVYVISEKNSYDDLYWIAHDISNEVYFNLIGEKGYFNSKIAYICENKLVVNDLDGRNQMYITDGTEKVLSPSLSFSGKYLAYLSFKDKGKSNIYMYDIATKKHVKLGNFKGLAMAPRFAPDDSKMLFSLSENGRTNIYKLDMLSKKISKLTFNSNINLAGGFSEDGSKIVFNSDKNGKPAIYTMDANGENINLLLGDKDASYYTPSWSPKGDLIAYTKIEKGNFYIGVISADGQVQKIISNDKYSESPSFATNGRNLIYQFEYDKNKRAFYIIDILSKNKLLLKQGANCIDPVFSGNVDISVKKNKVEYKVGYGD